MHGERAPLALRLVFLGKHLDHLIERRLAGRGVNRTQTIVLTSLRRRPGLRALDLCPHAGVEPANVTRTLQSLERQGLLERRPDPSDGRATLIYLTPRGEALAQSLSEDVEHLSAELLKGMAPGDLAILERSLTTLRQALSRHLGGDRGSGVDRPEGRSMGCRGSGATGQEAETGNLPPDSQSLEAHAHGAMAGNPNAR